MFNGLPLALIIVLAIIGIWDCIWKSIGMWKSARNSQLAWYVCILIFNTAGILPIVYLLFFQRKAAKPKARKRR
ncbi:hypothetical protein KY329_01775 [Candidatus Woesearchaeota archaeon]|nr:hypothetical protein [Candidatus Woesearchaeota archaeon]